MASSRDLLRKLFSGRDLSMLEASKLMTELMTGKPSPAEVGAMLGALSAKGETAEELAGLAHVMRAHAVHVRTDGDVFDTCGTGGSGLDTVNTSTLSAFVVAANGVTVAKHGNRSSAGHCGSMDVLEKLGVPIRLPVSAIESLLREVGIAFMYAPDHHPAVKYVAEVRKTLGVRTTFNFLGPLASPAGASRQLIGIGDERRAPALIAALALLGSKRAMVVHGQDGLDEITLAGASRIWSLEDGEIRTSVFEPEDLGLARAEPSALAGGTSDANAAVFERVLDDRAPAPIRDLVAVNAGAAFVVAERCATLRTGYDRARELLATGAVKELFVRYRDAARSEAEPGG